MAPQRDETELTEEAQETEKTEQPNLSRRWLLRAAAVAPAVAVPSLLVASPAEAAYRGKIKRSVVIKRAKNWYNRNIQHNMGGTASDPDGNHRYRRDCSGFVSMCWHIAAPGLITLRLPDIASRIAWNALKTGDIFHSNNHVMLFHKWDSNPEYIWIYDLVNPVKDMRHVKLSTRSLRQQYVPRRYKKIVNG